MSKKEIQVEIGILKIRDLGFFLDEIIDSGENSQLVYNLNIGQNSEEEWIEFILEAQFKNNITHETFMSGKAATRFFVKNLKNFVSNETIALPPDAMTTMFSMSFTHTRAILSKNMAGTKFDKMYLPIVNPNELLNSFFNEVPQSWSPL